jgi:hypothetical protein
MRINSDGSLEGSNSEKLHFRVNMLLWKHKYIILLAQFLTYLSIGLICKRFIAYIPVIFMVYSWLANTLYYPYRPPIFNFIKTALLQEGVFLRVNIEHDRKRCFSNQEEFALGVCLHYNEERRLYKVKVANEERYYDFHEISPLYWPEAYGDKRTDFSTHSGWHSS